MDAQFPAYTTNFAETSNPSWALNTGFQGVMGNAGGMADMAPAYGAEDTSDLFSGEEAGEKANKKAVEKVTK